MPLYQECHFTRNISVSVRSDLKLPELQQHLFERWSAFQQHIMDELIKQWSIQTPWFCVCTLNTGCRLSDVFHCFRAVNTVGLFGNCLKSSV